MNKAKNLLNPLSKSIRRLISSRSSPDNPSSYTCSHYIQSLSIAEPSDHTILPSWGFNFHSDFRFWGKSFCSESIEKLNGRCWNCNSTPQTTPFLVCDSCRCIQPVDHSVDYFQIFGLEKKYETEFDSLERKYKDWQKKLHPDLVHSKSEKEREHAAEQSARVIDAYRTLTKPLSRATYIMKLDGVEINEEETITEPELLSEIMEIREAVEDASDAQSLNLIQAQVQEKLRQWSDSFATAFQSQKFEEAIACIRRMTYYERVNEEIVKRL